MRAWLALALTCGAAMVSGCKRRGQCPGEHDRRAAAIALGPAVSDARPAPTQPPGVPPGLAVPPAMEVPDAAIRPSGAIQGLYTYPSHGIPPSLRACAVNVASQQTTCTSDHRMVTDHRGISGEGYRLVLPAGDDQAYEEFPGAGLRLAYYNEFVLCGFHIACQSHAKITLTVRPGVVLNGVLLGDWVRALRTGSGTMEP